MFLPYITPGISSGSIPRTVIVVGGGCSGLAIAEALIDRSTTCVVTVVDFQFKGVSTNTAPKVSYTTSPLSASRDQGRIIRDDYIHPSYRKIASAAMTYWKTVEPWCQFYHDSGLALVDGAEEEGLLRRTFNVSQEDHGATRKAKNIQEFSSGTQIQKICHLEREGAAWGYLNREAGWVNAEEVMKALVHRLAHVERMRLLPGKVVSLVKDTSGKTVRGVILESRSLLVADLIVLATGPWTSQLVDTTGISIASGEPMALVRLEDGEENDFNNMPAVVDFSQKICITPPVGGLLRVALHRQDWLNKGPFNHPEVGGMQVSMPLSCPEEGQARVRDSHRILLSQALRQISPPLQGKVVDLRYCWYDDTLTGDFIMAHHPDYSGLFMLHGLGAHGFKFAPVLGKYAVAALLGELDRDLEHLWSWPQRVSQGELEDHHGQGGWR